MTNPLCLYPDMACQCSDPECYSAREQAKRDAAWAAAQPPMTLRRAAQMALDVQSACNLSGVVRSFAEIVSWMRTDLKLDTEQCNTHAICRLFSEQIAHLTKAGMGDSGTYHASYDACCHIAKPPATNIDEQYPYGRPIGGCHCDECESVRKQTKADADYKAGRR